MQRRPAHELDVVGPLAEHPVRRFPGDGERLRQQLVQGFALAVPLAELVGLGPQFGVRQARHVVFEGVDVIGDVAQPLHHLALARAEQAVQHHPVDLTS